jgi:hypothetical protein
MAPNVQKENRMSSVESFFATPEGAKSIGQQKYVELLRIIENIYEFRNPFVLRIQDSKCQCNILGEKVYIDIDFTNILGPGFEMSIYIDDAEFSRMKKLKQKDKKVIFKKKDDTYTISNGHIDIEIEETVSNLCPGPIVQVQNVLFSDVGINHKQFSNYVGKNQYIGFGVVNSVITYLRIFGMSKYLIETSNIASIDDSNVTWYWVDRFLDFTTTKDIKLSIVQSLDDMWLKVDWDINLKVASSYIRIS